MLDSTRKTPLWGPSILLLACALGASGCLEDDPLPQLGECAVVPDDVGGFPLGEDSTTYEYGQVGIGTCIASPSDLRIQPDPEDADNHFLYVLNANARNNFAGSSLLAIDASSIDLSCPVNGMHEVAADALGMQEFVGRFDFDPDSGLALVTGRVTGGAEGTLNDVVFFVDTTDPRHLTFDDRAPRDFGPYAFLSVPADPWSVRINPYTGRAYVLSLTTHLVSGLDLSSDPVRFLDLLGEWEVGTAEFDDADDSGSAPDFQLLGVQDAGLEDETITVDWQDGTTRLYYPAADGAGGFGLFQADSSDGRTFSVLAGGPTLEGSRDWAFGGLDTATMAFNNDRIEGFVAGTDDFGVRRIGRLTSPDHAIDWNLGGTPVLEPLDGGWDAPSVTDPEWMITPDGRHHLWFTGGPGLGSAIGHAEGSAATSLARLGDADLVAGDEGVVLRPDPAGFDAAAVFAPAVIRSSSPESFRMYYSGHADAGAQGVPDGLAIGLAISDRADGGFVRTDRGLGGSAVVLGPGGPGEWDSAGVTMPAAFPSNDRWYLYYQGFDGSDWRTGRATSVDGITWVKDPTNPVFDGVVDAADLPRRAFAWKAAPGGWYRVEGDVTGPILADAFEGQVYDSLGSPVLFRIVGGQALGRGPVGSDDVSGVGSAASAADGEPVLYVGRNGDRRRLQLAADRGAGLSRLGPVTLSGFDGGLSALNGATPELPVRAVDAALLADGTTVAALQTNGAIVVAGGTLSDQDTAPALAALATAVVPAGGAEFDADTVASPSLVERDGELLLFYEGVNADTRAIGLATSADGGASWTREGAVLSRGAAGTWDDAWVAEPTVVWDADAALYHLWYRGSDGDATRFGYASSPDGRAWTRHTDSEGVTRSIWNAAVFSFSPDGAQNPQVRATADGFRMFFDAELEGTVRIARATSSDGLTWNLQLNPTTAGDRFTITTRRGDDDPATGVYLGDGGRNNRLIDGFLIHGAGASEMVISPDGRWGVVANKRDRFLIVIDLFDDSRDGYIDANYHDIEAVIAIPQSHGMVGVRDLVFTDGGETLWATLGPLIQPGAGDRGFGLEGLLRLDWQMEDDDRPRAILDGMITGFLPVARGVEEDRGYTTEVSVGPSSVAINRAGDRAYVTNFNDNSLYVLDLVSGARGAVIDVIRGIDENPWEVVLSPDERVAYVANYYGVQRATAQHSTVQVVDVDEASPTYGQVLTRLSNIGSRAEAGCE